ncbi:MFS transporter [Roseibium album]|nr:MFS transporter [Roseibium album]
MSLVLANPGHGAQPRLAVASLFLGAFMNILDVTIVNLALPSIRNEFDATTSQLEWVLIAYILMFASGLLPFGRFGDSFGRKRIFNFGVAGFLVSSLACGLAPDIELLIAARALQGLTASMMVPQVLAIVHVMFAPQEKAKLIGLYGTVSALGAVAGPLIGGTMISANVAGLEWRPIFLMNVPLGLVCLAGALRFVPDIEPCGYIKPDWSGSLLFALAVAALTFPLTEGRQFGWPWWCFALLGLSVVLALIFIQLQLHRTRCGLPQILPANLMKDRFFVRSLVIVTIFFSGIAGVHFMLAIFLQSGVGLSALQSGLATAPHPVGVMVASTLTSRLGQRWLGARIAFGTFVLLAGMTMARTVLGTNSMSITAVDLLLPMLTVGLGTGTAIAAMFQSTLSRVSPSDAGAGSGVLQAFQQVGIAIGIGAVGQIFFAGLEQAQDPADYVHAAQNALLFPIGIYLLLAATCLCIKEDNT